MYENALLLGASKRPQTPENLSDSFSELMAGMKRRPETKLLEVNFLPFFLCFNFTDPCPGGIAYFLPHSLPFLLIDVRQEIF